MSKQGPEHLRHSPSEEEEKNWSVPVERFPASQVEQRAKLKVNGKPRNPPVSLWDCQLLRMMQYECEFDRANARMTCAPFSRLFRRCAGGLMVETTHREYLKENFSREEMEQQSRN